MPVRLVRRLPLGLVAAAVTLVAAAPAHAGGLAVSATNCSAETVSQPFLQFGDIADYSLVPGGSFEPGAPAWSLGGGAQEVAGNESYDVGGAGDAQSLSLPAGSTATSPAMCVGIQNPDLRLFAMNTSDPASVLAVSVNYEGANGQMLTSQIGAITATGTWQPTVQDPILVNLLPLLPGNETPVSFTFTPQGAGNWQIDDVYIDPWGRS